jgi:hypothetical protein
MFWSARHELSAAPAVFAEPVVLKKFRCMKQIRYDLVIAHMAIPS